MKINHIDIAISELDADEELSFKNFSGWVLSDHPELDFRNKVIYASLFQQEIPGTQIFPTDLICTFVKCNLDNVIIPLGCTVIECTRTRFLVQNDLRDWELDEADKPTRVLNEKYWEMEGYSTDPRDIPRNRIDTVDEIPKRVR